MKITPDLKGLMNSKKEGEWKNWIISSGEDNFKGPRFFMTDIYFSN